MKVVLSIAGSDSSGGAGIQADLKTFEAFGVFGASAITVLTAQNTAGVRSIYCLPSQFVAEQIWAVLEDFHVDAIKIGMLYDTQIIETVHSIVAPLDIPVVLDPVCVSKAGSPLLRLDAIEALRDFSEKVTLSTPNLHEARLLFGYEMGESDSLKGVRHHPAPILVKNHPLMIPEPQAVDLLYHGGRKSVFSSPRIDTANLHGTGCSYSSAIAANLALGHPLEVSIERAKHFITAALRDAPLIGHGSGPINHKKGGTHVA